MPKTIIKLPEHPLSFAEQPPLRPGEAHPISYAEMGDMLGVNFLEGIVVDVADSRYTVVGREGELQYPAHVLSLLNQSEAQILQQFEDYITGRKRPVSFLIAEMPGVGKGLFINEDVKRGSLLGCYSGELVPSRSAISDYVMTVHTRGLPHDISVDAAKRRGVFAMMQHAPEPFYTGRTKKLYERQYAPATPAPSELQDLHLFNQLWADQIATENTAIVEIIWKGMPLVLVFASTDLYQDTQVFKNYGYTWWKARGTVPALFSKRNEIIPPTDYRRGIFFLTILQSTGYSNYFGNVNELADSMVSSRGQQPKETISEAKKRGRDKTSKSAAADSSTLEVTKALSQLTLTDGAASVEQSTSGTRRPVSPEPIMTVPASSYLYAKYGAFNVPQSQLFQALGIVNPGDQTLSVAMRKACPKYFADREIARKNPAKITQLQIALEELALKLPRTIAFQHYSRLLPIPADSSVSQFFPQLNAALALYYEARKKPESADSASTEIDWENLQPEIITAVCLAIEKDMPDTLKLLLTFVLDINRVDSMGIPPFYHAAMMPNPTCYEILLREPLLRSNVANQCSAASLQPYFAPEQMIIVNDYAEKNVLRASALRCLLFPQPYTCLNNSM